MTTEDKMLKIKEQQLRAERKSILLSCLKELHQLGSIKDYEYEGELKRLLDSEGFNVRCLKNGD